MAEPTEKFDDLISAIQQLKTALEANTAEIQNPKGKGKGGGGGPDPKEKDPLKELEKSLKNFSVREQLLTSAFGEKAGVVGALMDGLGKQLAKFGKIISDAMKMAMDGIKLATEIGTTAQEGVALDFANQWQSIKSILTFDANQMVNKDELAAAEKSVADALVGFGTGLEVSAGGVTQLLQNFRTGFNTTSNLSGETLKNLAFIGATTTQEFQNLRTATGRQSLSNNQLNSIIGKNVLSFQIFGNAIAKRAADLDRLGISLDSVNKNAESYVTSLDNQLDTIAQLNQLGADIDFGRLTMLQEFDPAAAQKYLAEALDPELLKSSSFRALAGQLGDVGELMKVKTEPNFTELEKATTKVADQTGKTTNSFAALSKAVDIVKNSFLGLIGGLAAAIVSLMFFMAAVNKAGMVAGLNWSTLGKGLFSSLQSVSGMLLKGVGAIGIAVGAIALGASLMSSAVEDVRQGKTGQGVVKGAGAGAIIAGGLALALAIPTGGISLAALGGTALVGAGLGGGYAYMAGTADDAQFPAGYGDRMVVNPSAGTILGINNSDYLQVGTNLQPKGSLGVNTPTTDPKLMNKLDALISALSEANTTVNIDGATRTVNRMGLVNVKMTRSEQYV